jgi:hypothetical protein
MANGSFCVAHPVSGKPVELLETRLTAEHIKAGQFIWYDGFTVMSYWSCPAVIIKVNRKKKTFRVMSLDDFVPSDVDYDFAVDENSDFPRQTMRIIELARVDAYLKAQRQKLVGSVDDAERAVLHARGKLSSFDRGVEALNLKEELPGDS